LKFAGASIPKNNCIDLFKKSTTFPGSYIPSCKSAFILVGEKEKDGSPVLCFAGAFEEEPDERLGR
jgi:hypothetical protein